MGAQSYIKIFASDGTWSVRRYSFNEAVLELVMQERSTDKLEGPPP